MRPFLVVIAVSLSLFACSSAGEQPTGGVSGSVTRGPTCPVETANSPCPPGIWTGTVRATASGGKTFEVQTDDQGRYALSLPDGTYDVVAVIDGDGPPSATPVSVTVTGGSMQTLDLQVDTGIR